MSRSLRICYFPHLKCAFTLDDVNINSLLTWSLLPSKSFIFVSELWIYMIITYLESV